MSPSGPSWWYDSWGPSDWFETFFNQPLEIHTFVLGLSVGIILGYSSARCRPVVSSLLTFAVVLFALGAVDTGSLCNESYTACRHIRLKPWYFPVGFLCSNLLTRGVAETFVRNHRTIEKTPENALIPLLGSVIVLLTGVTAHSFVEPPLVWPTIGVWTF